MAPAPSAGTGSHRYVYLLYTQPKALNTKSFASLGFNTSARTGFNVYSLDSLKVDLQEANGLHSLQPFVPLPALVLLSAAPSLRLTQKPTPQVALAQIVLQVEM